MTHHEMLEQIETFPKQIEDSLNLVKEVNISGDIDKLFVIGMGGSGKCGDVVAAVVSKVPVYVVKNYDLPAKVTSNSLVIAVSYSGNTEECLAAARQAYLKGAKLLGVASGGKLKDSMKEWNKPCILVPTNYQPRAALGFMIVPILMILHYIGLIPNPKEDLKAVAESLKKSTWKEQAQKLADNMQGKTPIIYAGKLMAAAGRWKTQFNENAKLVAHEGEFPEINHNEIEGFGKPAGEFYIFILEDEQDHNRVKLRMKIMKEQIASKSGGVSHLAIKGNSPLVRLLTAIYLGDLVSYFAAINNNVNAIDVHIIEDFKAELAKHKF